MSRPVSNLSTTADELVKIERWLEQRRGEQFNLRTYFRSTNDMKTLARISLNAVLIEQAEHLAAVARVMVGNAGAEGKGK